MIIKTKENLNVLINPELKDALEDLYRQKGTGSFSTFIEDMLRLAYREMVI